jgi:hypothetical protein
LEWRAEPQRNLANRSTAEIATAGSITRREQQVWQSFYNYLHTKSSEFRQQIVTSWISYLLAAPDDVNPDFAKGLACLASTFSSSSLIINNPRGTFFAPTRKNSPSEFL